MVFSSLLFIFWFLPVFFAVYYLTPEKLRNTVLFIGSIVFYAWGEPKYLLLIFVSIIINYAAGLMIDRSCSHKTLFMTLALVFDFSMLFVFKYLDFFIRNINGLTGLGIGTFDLSLPLGISFYTFQIASYVIDVKRGKVSAERNIIKLGTYLVMFPQLIAGPIVIYKDVSLKLSKRKTTMEGVSEGVKIFVLGLSSKVLIANGCGALWDDIAAKGYDGISMPLAWLCLIAYTLQIYFDFNGYSLMAVGLGRMLGFDLPYNFDHPYISRSLTEFWRRWHITLSAWFRDYIYIPLGGNRKGKIRTYVNLFIVWFLTGFWHGAGWNFIIWGLFFFAFLTMEKLFISDFLKRHVIFSHIYSLLLIGLSWMIFAITDFGKLITFFKRLISFDVGTDILYYGRNYGILILLGCLFSTTLPGRIFKKYENKAIGTIFLTILFLLNICFLAGDSYNPFLYFRF